MTVQTKTLGGLTCVLSRDNTWLFVEGEPTHQVEAPERVETYYPLGDNWDYTVIK